MIEDGYPVKDWRVKYYMVGEYGSETQRPHFHSIIFNLPQIYLDNPWRLECEWQQGHVHVGKVTGASIAYCCGYVQKSTFLDDEEFARLNGGLIDDRHPECTRMSQQLGASFMTDQRIAKIKRDLNPFVRIIDGQTIALPHYYRNFKKNGKEVLAKREREVISANAMAFAEENEPFDSPRHEHEYIKAEALKLKRKNKTRM